MLAHRLKQLRLSRGLTQEELADEFHISKQTICRYEIGTREPSISILTALAEFYEVDFNYLFGCSDKHDHYDDADILMIQKFHSLDNRGRSAVLNVLEHEYVNFKK